MTIDCGLEAHDRFVNDELALALELADMADEITARRFEAGDYVVRSKKDGGAVTDVDVQVEAALAARVTGEHPADAFLGEELGRIRTGGDNRRTWIVDGIDGTSSFTSGGTAWGTLVALQQDGEIEVGVASSPGLRRRWWASRGEGAWRRELSATGGASEPVRLEVSARRRDARAVVAPARGVLGGWRDEVVCRAEDSLTAVGKAGLGPLLVAGGEIEVAVHLWGGPWDHAPFVVIVEEAGGEFSDLWGGRRIDTETAVYTNGLLHQHARDIVGRAAPDGFEAQG